MNIQELRSFVYVYRQLVKISQSLHALDENACNYGLSKRQEKRQENLEKKADLLAKDIGLYVYHQGDPRGCSLYLTKNKTRQEYNYTDGIAIY